MAVGGIGALIGEHFQLPRHIGAVGPHIGDDMEFDGVTDPVADECILPGDVDLHQPTAQFPADPAAEGLVEGVLLVAEAAADIGLDDADGTPGHADGLTHRAAHDVGDLGGGDDDGLAGLLIGVADEVFDVAVLDRGGGVPLVDADEARLLAGFLIVAFANGGVLQDVVGEFLVDAGLPLLHGFDGVQDEGQLLILHLHQPGRLGTGHLVFGHHRSHVVAIVAHVSVEQKPIRHVLMGLFHGPGVPGRGEGDIGHVEAGEYPYDPRHLHGFGDVHGFHKPVGNGGAHHTDEQGAPIA